MDDDNESPDPDRLWTVRAAWVFPVAGPPLKNGAVTISGKRIVAVEAVPSRTVDEELADSALLPGLVNAHTHLEFSDLAEPLGEPGGRFADWIGKVIAYRASRIDEAVTHQAIIEGMEESAAEGVALAGEIATNDWASSLGGAAWSSADDVGPTFFAFREILGLAAERSDELFATAERFLTSSRSRLDRRFAGLSPHAPYTVRFDLFERLVGLCAKYERPVAMHLAESGEELELLRSHSGASVEFLSARGFWRPDAMPRGARILDYMEVLQRAPSALVVHGTFLDDEEIAFLAERRDRMTVVYCPRTHARLIGGKYPLEDFLAAGVRVALGTDSRASNPDLSLWNEVKSVRERFPRVPPERLLEMATKHGAEALMLSDRFGTIEPGRTSRLATISLDASVQSTAANQPPWDALFAESAQPGPYVPGART
ncbi:MAG TPA: amidohydrolase family protein [Pirellulaceae bacterium]|jgi:cytosine/adenosine deaminase-related metal-dependent hydrolase|nr:amidohydrolase family protein [Pirellulaceae bacterium]